MLLKTRALITHPSVWSSRRQRSSQTWIAAGVRSDPLQPEGVRDRSDSAQEIIHRLERQVEEISETSDVVKKKSAEGTGFVVRDASKLKDGELPRVAIVGRPNVGKSALLNRLTKSSKAIVFDKPGITRDRLMVRAFWQRSEFMLMDTGGLPDTKVVSGVENLQDVATEKEIPVGVEKQVAAAVEESDVVIFVVDGQEGPMDGDFEILTWLRKQHSKKPVVMAVNKCEGHRLADFNASLFWELGLEPHPVSAISGLGTGDLLDTLVTKMPPMHHRKEVEEITSVAIIGRPNTGKSSLLNAMVGEDRAIVSKIPGTTRDAIDCRAKLFSGEMIKLIDTAGIRRQTAVHGSAEKVEPLMVNRSLKAMDQCNVAVLMIDCYEGIRQQDARIIDAAEEYGCGLVVVGNKFDLLNPKDWDKQTVKAILKQQLRDADWAVIVVTSLTNEHPLKAISKAILAADGNHARRLTTSTINMIVQDAVHFRPPPATRTGKKGRIYYATQAAIRPPTFILFVNDASLFDDSYKRYIEKHLRENIELDGTPVRVVFKGKPQKPRM